MPTRRAFLQTSAALLLAPRVFTRPARSLRVYLGTYTNKDSQGIYTALFDTASGMLTDLRLAAEAESPSFLAISPDRRHLYAVNELGEFNGAPGGAVSAFGIDRSSGMLRFLNQQPTMGAHPCHLVVDRTGRWVLVANYSGGNLTVLPAARNGRLEPPATIVRHSGRGVNESRQEAPHAHAIQLDARNRFAYAADLGIDKLLVYRWDGRTGALTPNDPPAYTTTPGAGPRHFAFHPSGRFVFLINELDSTLSVLRLDPRTGVLEELHTLSTLPDGFSGENSCADVHVTPDGRYVYGSNRGHDSLAGFAFDARAGRLEPLGHTPTGGRTPRNFAIAPGGDFLLAANQNSDTVTSFRIDPQTGLLEQVATAEAPTPVCVRFMD